MYLAKISSLPTRLNVINANIQAGHPHGPANPTLGCASQDSKAVLSPKRIWPWGFRFCSTFSSAPWAEDVQGMWARLHGYWPSVMPEFQRAGVPPPKHLELPSDSPAGCKGLTWGKHCKRDRVASRSQQQQPQPRDHVNIPRMQFHPCLPAWPQRTQIHAPDHAYTEANTSTLPQWPHPFMVSPCSTPAWQTLPFTAADKFQTTCFEQKARVYFKQATKTNIIVWNTLSCPQVKHCLLTVLHSLLAHRTGLPEWLQLRGDQHKECEFFKIMLYANFF